MTSNTADQTKFRKYEVNTVYYTFTRQRLGEKYISDVFDTWKCVEEEVEEDSGCKRFKYKFVLVVCDHPMGLDEKHVIYTSGKYDVFMTFDEFVERVLRAKKMRDNAGWPGGPG